jgi:acetyltransferase-like isoleucine patch superfamily enzyme
VRLHTPGGVIRIGEYAFMSYNVSVTSMNRITIGNRVKIANNVVIVDHDHDYKNNNIGYKTGSVVIEDDVWIGANCVILKDTHIGHNCVIAAGSVVKGNIPARTVWGPSLAAKIKEF